jgi:ATP-dependent DNA helicase RecG
MKTLILNGSPRIDGNTMRLVDAIREALLNSFCHKDYSTGQSNEVAIYKDRIEIYNPGAFPEGFEPQDFIERPERPIRRNPKIARILYYSKDIESFGTGLKRIADACENAGVRYEFKKLKSGFVVCFYRSEKSTEKRRKASDKKQATKTSDNIQKIRSFLEKNGVAKSREIADYINLSPARTRVILREMDDVEAVGENKNRRYRLKN